MLHSKYLLVSAMSLSTFAYCADEHAWMLSGQPSCSHLAVEVYASESSDEIVHPSISADQSTGSSIRITNWFDQDTITVPDDSLVHRPFVSGHVRDVSTGEKIGPWLVPGAGWLHLLSEGAIGLRTSKMFHGVAGFVSGSDQEGVSAIADAVATLAVGIHPDYANVKKSIVASDPRLLEKVKDCAILFGSCKRANNGHHFKPDRSIGYDHGFEDANIEVQNLRGVILPQAHMHLIDKLMAVKKYTSRSTLVADLKLAAQGLCAKAQSTDPGIKIVEIPMLTLKADITEFHHQLFDDETN